MKKLSILICSLLVSVLVLAQQFPEEMLVAIKPTVSSGGSGGCNFGSTNNGGTLGTGTGQGWSYITNATCSGTLESVEIVTKSASQNFNLLVAVYADDGDGTPDASDTLVGSGTYVASGPVVGVKVVTMSGGSITSGTGYWVVVVDYVAAGVDVGYDLSGPPNGQYSSGYTWSSSTAPANMTGSGTITWNSFGRWVCGRIKVQ